MLNIKITGPAKSGKTTLAKTIAEALKAHGIHVTINDSDAGGIITNLRGQEATISVETEQQPMQPDSNWPFPTNP